MEADRRRPGHIVQLTRCLNPPMSIGNGGFTTSTNHETEWHASDKKCHHVTARNRGRLPKSGSRGDKKWQFGENVRVTRQRKRRVMEQPATASGVHLIKGMTITNPSPRHQWVYLRGTSALYTGAVERCARCGAHFVEKADTRGPIYCAPTPQWLSEHPEDDRKER